MSDRLRATTRYGRFACLASVGIAAVATSLAAVAPAQGHVDRGISARVVGDPVVHADTATVTGQIRVADNLKRHRGKDLIGCRVAVNTASHQDITARPDGHRWDARVRLDQGEAARVTFTGYYQADAEADHVHLEHCHILNT